MQTSTFSTPCPLSTAEFKTRLLAKIVENEALRFKDTLVMDNLFVPVGVVEGNRFKLKNKYRFWHLKGYYYTCLGHVKMSNDGTIIECKLGEIKRIKQYIHIGIGIMFFTIILPIAIFLALIKISFWSVLPLIILLSLISAILLFINNRISRFRLATERDLYYKFIEEVIRKA